MINQALFIHHIQFQSIISSWQTLLLSEWLGWHCSLYATVLDLGHVWMCQSAVLPSSHTRTLFSMKNNKQNCLISHLYTESLKRRSKCANPMSSTTSDVPHTSHLFHWEHRLQTHTEGNEWHWLEDGERHFCCCFLHQTTMDVVLGKLDVNMHFRAGPSKHESQYFAVPSFILVARGNQKFWRC